MSQFGFGTQIGSPRDAITGSSRSNYQSEEADLTDAMIANVEKIDIPNTNQFFENIKFVERVKDQGNFINTMKQIAGVFEGAAKFKTAYDALQAKNDTVNEFLPDKKTGIIGGTTFKAEDIVNQVEEAAKVTNKEDQAAQNELNKTSIDLTNEKNATDNREHKSNITDLQTQIGPNSNLFTATNDSNFRAVGNQIDGQISPTYGVLSAQDGLGGVNTMGEAQESVGMQGTTGKIIAGLFYEYKQAIPDLDITNRRVQKRIIARHAKTIKEAQQAALNTWSTNQAAKIELQQKETLRQNIRIAVSQGDANAIFGEGGYASQAADLLYAGDKGAAGLGYIWAAEEIKKSIDANVIVGTEGFTISDNMVDDIFRNSEVTIKGTTYSSLQVVPDNIISATVKGQAENIVRDAVRKRQTQQANDIETDIKNFNNNFVASAITKPLQDLATDAERKDFLSFDNMNNIRLQYYNEISKKENRHLMRFDLEGRLIFPSEINNAVAKSETGGSDTNVATAQKYAPIFNELEEKVIKSAVQTHKYNDGGKTQLSDSDYFTVSRAREAFENVFLSEKAELDKLLAQPQPGKSRKSIELDFMQKLFEEKIEPNIKSGVYDKAGEVGGSVSKGLVQEKGFMVELFNNDPTLKDSTSPVTLAEKANFERSKLWSASNGQENKDVLEFYKDIKMYKMVRGRKVPMTNLEKWTYRAKAIGGLKEDEANKILEFDRTRVYFTEFDRARLSDKPTDGKYLQVSGETLQDFRQAMMALKPQADGDFDSFEIDEVNRRPRARGAGFERSIPSLQTIKVGDIPRLVKNKNMNNIGYFNFEGTTLAPVINELIEKKFIRPDQDFDENVQIYTRLYMLSKNINQRRRSLSGLTVLPFQKGKQPLNATITGADKDEKVVTLDKVEDNSDWLEIANFSYNDQQILNRVFPLFEKYPFVSYAYMAKGVSQVHLTAAEKGGKFFEIQEQIQQRDTQKAKERREAVKEFFTPKPVDTTKRRKRN